MILGQRMMETKIIFHESFLELYASEPAAAAGRMEAIVEALGSDFEFVKPQPASAEDLALVHTKDHIERIKRQKNLYEISLLSVGGATMAAEIGWKGRPAFGLIRPPGHHASPDCCWGFCYFNNMAIAIKILMKKGKATKVFILDFDLHYGDGTENSFKGSSAVLYFHPEGSQRHDFIESVQKGLEQAGSFDILAVSAGFDRHVDDWGGLLTTKDYGTIGSLVKTYSQKICQGRRFAVLEGGYNHAVLGHNVRSFIEGMN